LESTIQYANSFAIILLISILVSLYHYSSTKSNVSLSLVCINSIGLLLTYSRSVWVIWLLGVVTLIIIIPNLRNLKSILYIVLSHFFALVSAIVIQKDILFFMNRLTSIHSSAPEFQIRFVYWKDSIGILSKYWLGGTGGGGWAVLQHQFQSQQYFVKFIHNHYLQVIIDVGLIGGLMALLLIGMFYFRSFLSLSNSQESITDIRALLLFSSVLLVHAAFDFDLTYPIIMAFFICIIFSLNWSIKEIPLTSLYSKCITLFPAVALFCILIWIGTGYSERNAGAKLSIEGQFSAAEVRLQRASEFIPWSSTIYYELAKNQVRWGNESKDAEKYNNAKTFLDIALSKTPEQQTYRRLYEQMNRH